MSEQLQRFRDEQASTWQRMLAIRAAAEADKRELSAEERQNWDAAEERLQSISGDIERLERMDRMDAVNRDAVVRKDEKPDAIADEPNPEENYRDAFYRYARRGMNGISPEDRSLLMDHMEEIRAGATSPGSAGGYLIPADTLAKLTDTMKAYGGILGVANVVTTSTGNPLNWPTADDTGNVGAILAENNQTAEQDVTFGQKTLGSYTYTSKLVRISLQLLQDNIFSVDSWLTGKLGQRIGRAVSAHLATGTGTGQPEGLITNAVAGKTGAAGQVTSVITDDLYDLVHSVDPAYRTTSRWVLSDSALKVVRKLKDSQNRPLWEPSVQAGVPSTLLGYPITIDNGVPVPAASAKSIGFGDINAAYVVRQVQGGQMLRLDERYADFLQVGFLGFLRLDAKPDDPAAFRVYAHPAS